MKIRLSLTVNGEPVEVLADDYKTLLEVLREDLGLTGTKHGCELGECGACAVLVDGNPLLSCLLLAVESESRDVTTVEGLAAGGQLHPLQECFADLGAAQCGYCTPGILMTAKALLDREPHPSRDRIREALSGNLCRCTGYAQIIDAVEAAACANAEERVEKGEPGVVSQSGCGGPRRQAARETERPAERSRSGASQSGCRGPRR